MKSLPCRIHFNGEYVRPMSEIEAALVGGSVAQAAVIAREDGRGGQALVGYVMTVPPVGFIPYASSWRKPATPPPELYHSRVWAFDGLCAVHETKSSARVYSAAPILTVECDLQLVPQRAPCTGQRLGRCS
jgi:hypothetical protein